MPTITKWFNPTLKNWSEMMRASFIALLLAAGITGCVQITKVGVGPRKELATYSVSPTSPWNRLDTGRTVIWTKDGLGLQELAFFKAVGDDQQLLNGRPGVEMPKFRADMRATDIMDFVLASMTAQGMQAVEGGRLRPYRFAGNRGFRFDMSYVTSGGNMMTAEVFGAVIDDELHVVAYAGHPEF